MKQTRMWIQLQLAPQFFAAGTTNVLDEHVFAAVREKGYEPLILEFVPNDGASRAEDHFDYQVTVLMPEAKGCADSPGYCGSCDDWPRHGFQIACAIAAWPSQQNGPCLARDFDGDQEAVFVPEEDHGAVGYRMERAEARRLAPAAAHGPGSAAAPPKKSRFAPKVPQPKR